MSKDKCNICGWVGNSDLVIQDTEGKWVCPMCFSEDVDDADDEPVDDDDGDDPFNDYPDPYDRFMICDVVCIDFEMYVLPLN